MSHTASPLHKLVETSQHPLTEHWIDALDDGTHVLIRPLQEHDREREFQFIQRLSAESRRARFFSSFSEPPAALLDQLMTINHPLQMAYVALVHDNGELREVGIARYAQTQEQQCEFAVVVADDWQRKGLGRLLMGHLMDAARRNGFKRMAANDLASNVHLHRLLKRLGFESCHAQDDFSEIVHHCLL